MVTEALSGRRFKMIISAQLCTQLSPRKTGYFPTGLPSPAAAFNLSELIPSRPARCFIFCSKSTDLLHGSPYPSPSPPPRTSGVQSSLPVNLLQLYWLVWYVSFKLNLSLLPATLGALSSSSLAPCYFPLNHGKVKARSRRELVKVKARSRRGQGKVKRQGQQQ